MLCYLNLFFRYRNMKKRTVIYFILIFLVPKCLSAQMYMRTKKNIGIFSNYNFPLINPMNNQSVSIGITKQFGAYVLPEFGYRMNFNDNDREITNFTNNSLLFGAVNFRKRLFLINKRRVGSCCQAELVEILCAPEYFFKFWDKTQQNSSNIRVGIGIYHVQSGYSKRSKSWTLKLEGYYRMPISNESFIKNEIGIQLRILRHQIYDFLN